VRISNRKIQIPAIVGLVVLSLLTIVQAIPDKPLLLAERFIHNGGWIQVFVITLYSFILSYNMQFRDRRSKWRIYSWMIFTVVFYSQLVLGLCADSLFLLTGKLHVPVPAMILAGPLYRFSSWFMIILFFSTVLIAGPAWCSHLCYFGSLDAVVSRRAGAEKRKGQTGVIPVVKYSILLIIVIVALVLRIARASAGTATLLAILTGVAALLVISLISLRKGVMFHCTHYCPIGTVVNYIKFISPFRFGFTSNCIKCNACIKSCSYMALNDRIVKAGKLGLTCTYCGDCLNYCRHNGLGYHFAGLSPEVSEKLWIIITVSLHSLFLAVARI
jgi:polyferredoxin